MIRHHYPSVLFVMSEFVRPTHDRRHNDLGDRRNPQVSRAGSRIIKQTIENGESFARRYDLLRKTPTWRKTVVEPKGDEQRLTKVMPVWKAPLIKNHRN